MGKEATKYLKEDPFKIIEEGLHLDRLKVSESIFSLANEYTGIRGSFDEGSDSLDSLRGSYFNGIYEYAKKDTPSAYLGIVKRTHFMINSVDWTKVKIVCLNQKLDLGKVKFSKFYRELDMKSGLYTRSFTWKVAEGKHIDICFERLLSMTECHKVFQVITLKTNFDCKVDLELSLNSNVLHWGQDCYWDRKDEFVTDENIYALRVNTQTTNQKLVSTMLINGIDNQETFIDDKEITCVCSLLLKANETRKIERYVVNIIDKNNTATFDEMLIEAKNEVKASKEHGFEYYLDLNKKYWTDVWHRSDIVIDGSLIDQQGIRFCIFQLEQTYHGYAMTDNIGAKGLTGEAYSGHAFWDSETYCLPYYLFHNTEAAKDLLLFRYNTLKQAKERAKTLDCKGACYPIATLNGEEGCNLWQHASLQFQPSTAVAYGIYHYMRLTNDVDFLKKYGIEMLLEISQFLLTRGQWDQKHEYFGFYAVMGPDEFQMMVNHNTYTNYMAKKTFDYTLDLIEKYKDDAEVSNRVKELGFDETFLKDIRHASEHMKIIKDNKTGLYEQHEGFFNLPHIDVDSIPVNDFPLYSHWSYDRIYRNDMIKQPDVLMFMFLYSSEFSLAEKKFNYDYYEPRCIHESSLSPSIHSIFANELGYEQQALDFFGFATRMDLDDYNRNTCEGLHMTSIAAGFMNIVYGFGGLKSDGEMLELAPTLPKIWNSYSFSIVYHGSVLKIDVKRENVTIICHGNEVTLKLYGNVVTIKDKIIVER